MSYKYLDKTGLLYYNEKIKTKIDKKISNQNPNAFGYFRMGYYNENEAGVGSYASSHNVIIEFGDTSNIFGNTYVLSEPLDEYLVHNQAIVTFLIDEETEISFKGYVTSETVITFINPPNGLPTEDDVDIIITAELSNIASGDYSHAEGEGTVAIGNAQHVQGKFNEVDIVGKYLHIVGNGTSDTNRSNAHTVDTKGNAWYAGDISTESMVKSPNRVFAEIGEWADENTSDERRLGYFVTVANTTHGVRISKAGAESDIRGVTVANPAFTTNVSDDKYDMDGTLKSKYAYVAFSGCAIVIDNGSCQVNSRCVPDDNGCAVPSQNSSGYRVIDRVDDTKILVIIEGTTSLSGSGVISLTTAEYEARKDYYDNSDNIIVITDIDTVMDATAIGFNNATSELVSTNVQDALNEIASIAKGVNCAKVFDSLEEMNAWLKDPANKLADDVGTNIYITDVEVPDFWIKEVLETPDSEGFYYHVSQLETEKIDLTTYDEAIEDIREELAEKIESESATDFSQAGTPEFQKTLNDIKDHVINGKKLIFNDNGTVTWQSVE